MKISNNGYHMLPMPFCTMTGPSCGLRMIPVFRVINKHATPIRQGRGLAPVEIELPFELESPVLAVGAHMKNTVTLAWQNRAVVSPHIGEMDSPRSLQTFEQCIIDLQALYQVKAEHIVCDAHPGYTPTRWAYRQNLPVDKVFHHHAHASAAYVDALRNDENLGQHAGVHLGRCRTGAGWHALGRGCLTGKTRAMATCCKLPALQVARRRTCRS